LFEHAVLDEGENAFGKCAFGRLMADLEKVGVLAEGFCFGGIRIVTSAEALERG
jgi:hypothetical protein